MTAEAARILIIEPDKRLAMTYAQALRRLHYEVDSSTNAQEAIMAADAAKPDLVLLELQLTMHSGMEFLYEFRSYVEWRDIPVIVVSTVPPTEFENSYGLLQEHLGVTAFHYKPHTSLRVLSHAVEQALAGRRHALDGNAGDDR